MKFSNGVDDNKNNFGTFNPLPAIKIPTQSIDEIINKKMETVTVPNKVEPNTSLNLFEYLQATYYKIKTAGEEKMLEAIKTFLLPKIIQWIMKGAGSILVYIGITKQNPSAEEIIGGVLAFGVSAVWSLISTGKIALTDPKEFAK